MFFSRNPPSSQVQQCPAITSQGCVSSSPLLVTGGLRRGCELLGANTHISLLPETSQSPHLSDAAGCALQQSLGLCWPPSLSPLLGRGGPKSKSTENQGREGAGRPASQVLSDSEVDPWETVRTEALSRFSPLPSPRTWTLAPKQHTC